MSTHKKSFKNWRYVLSILKGDFILMSSSAIISHNFCIPLDGTSFYIFDSKKCENSIVPTIAKLFFLDMVYMLTI